MISDKFGAYMSPDVIARHNDWYNDQGQVIWGKLAMSHMKFEKRLRLFSPSAVEQDLKDKNKAVMLEVNFGTHWILADRRMWLRNDYVCRDPWTGKACAAKGDYYNVTGSAHFLKQ